MNQLPESVKIGPVTYAVREEVRTAIDASYGCIVYADSLISLMPGQSPIRQQITLWHEMIHGILMQAGVLEHDESVVVAISYGIVQVLADNPALVGVGE